MDLKTISSSVIASVVFGILSGYVLINSSVSALEAEQKQIISRQARQEERQIRQADIVRSEIQELRAGQQEILRYLRNSK